MPSIEKKKSGDASTSIIERPQDRPGFKPNRNSVVLRPYKHVAMTKAEMYEDLRKAVENTK